MDKSVEEEPQKIERAKQTAKCGRPFGNSVCKSLQVKKCSVNLKREKDENTKPVLEKKEAPKPKQPKRKEVVKKDEKTDTDTSKKKNKEVKDQPVPDEVKKPVSNEEQIDKTKYDEKEEEKLEITKIDMKTEESKTEQQEKEKEENLPDILEVKSKDEGTFHMETAMVMDNDNAEDIHKESMEVIGDSLKIKDLEDKIENMLINRTQVKDTQKRIQVLQNILNCLQKEALDDKKKEKNGFRLHEFNTGKYYRN